jgi:hypothetical protein
MQSKDIRQSRLIWDICGGLRLNLAKNRRSSGDKDLFRRFTGMYDHADADEFLPSYVAKWMEKYPYDDRLGLLCEHYFVVSHKLRMAMNRLTNYHLAERHKPVIFLPAAGKLHGVTMQPQDMIIWKGMELLCCSRRYLGKKMAAAAAAAVLAFPRVSNCSTCTEMRLCPSCWCAQPASRTTTTFCQSFGAAIRKSSKAKAAFSWQT